MVASVVGHRPVTLYEQRNSGRYISSSSATNPPLPDTSLSVDEIARFEALYRENYGRVLGYALRRASAHAAHDVVADTFLVAWRRLEHVPETPLPWLLGVARRTLANQRRAAGRRAALVAEFATAASAHPAQPSDGVETLGALERLPAADQELLKLVALGRALDEGGSGRTGALARRLPGPHPPSEAAARRCAQRSRGGRAPRAGALSDHGGHTMRSPAEALSALTAANPVPQQDVDEIDREQSLALVLARREECTPGGPLAPRRRGRML